MFTKIMTPVDLSHADSLGRALDAAAAMSRISSAPVVCVGVTTNEPSAISHSPQEFAGKLEAFATEAGAARGVQMTAHAVTSHDPSVDMDETLLKVAGDIGADLIVVGSHVPDVADRIWAGHGQTLASRAPASVLVVR